MANTYVNIASSTVGAAGAASIVFSSIPQTYTDLYVVVSARSNRGSNGDDVIMRFNSDSGNNYQYSQLYGFSGGPGGVNNTGNQVFMGQMPTIGNANTFNISTGYILNYAGSTQKTVSIENCWEENSTTSWQENFYCTRWTNTSAITSITISSGSSSVFNQYTTATLYGIRKD